MSYRDAFGVRQHHPLDAVEAAPSDVLFVEASALSTAADKDANFTNLEDASEVRGAASRTSEDMQPRLKAFRLADGRWVTTDWDQLELCRRLEKAGVWRQISMEVLPLSEGQEEKLRRTLSTSTPLRNESTSSGDDPTFRMPAAGYQVLDEGICADDAITPQTSSSEPDHGSASSDSDDSSSECDWSGEDRDSSEENSEEDIRPKKSVDEQDATDTETECLL